LHPDGRTDITKLMVAFRIFANTAKNLRLKYLWMPSVTLCKYDTEMWPCLCLDRILPPKFQ